MLRALSVLRRLDGIGREFTELRREVEQPIGRRCLEVVSFEKRRNALLVVHTGVSGRGRIRIAIKQTNGEQAETHNQARTLVSAVIDGRAGVGGFVRRLASTAYFRATAFNYEHRLFARWNRTPAGSFRCYDLVNRHGRDRMLAAIASRCGPADVVYDVGAHVGVYALALAANGPSRRIYAFEPSPPVVECLVANVARNRFGDSIELHAYGLGSSNCRRSFYVSTNPELSAFDVESATRWGARIRETRTVPVRRLDDLSIPPPDLLKLDVEGAAPAVLEGGHATIDRARPTVVVEIHEEGVPGDRTTELRERLSELDYGVETHDGFWVCEPRG